MLNYANFSSEEFANEFVLRVRDCCGTVTDLVFESISNYHGDRWIWMVIPQAVCGDKIGIQPSFATRFKESIRSILRSPGTGLRRLGLNGINENTATTVLDLLGDIYQATKDDRNSAIISMDAGTRTLS